MPIVNGQYVYDTIPTNFTDQSVTGIKPSKRDFSDSKTAQLNYIMKQQEQAYNLELWNLQNQYNSPAEQMKRYQDAGLNPNLIYQQQNTAQSPASASAPSFRSGGTYNKSMATALSMIGQIMNTVKAARETYDYMRYGREEHAWQRNLTMQRSQGQALENYWNSFLLGMDNLGENSPIPASPRARMYQFQMDTQEQRYEQLKALVNMIPDQQARTRALQELDKERLHILQSQTGFITNFDTGHPEFDSFFKMLAFFVMNSGT